MIKSKLIMVISSVGLVATLGVGCTSLSLKEDNSQDNIVKNEVKEDASNEVASEEKDNMNTNNATDDEANATKEAKGTSNSISSNNENVVSSKNEVNNNYDEIENEVEELLNTQSCDKPSDNNPNTPSDTPSQDTSVPSEDSNIPSQDTNIPSQDSDKPLDDTNKPSEIPDEPVVSDSNYIAEIEQAIFQRVNQERAAIGLPALSYNTTMEHYARIKSKDMADNGYFSHEDLKGNLITEQMKADGVSYKAWGENIAYIQGIDDNSVLATKFMDNWMNSSGHRANILSTNFSSIGIGVYKIGNTYYATQEFYR